MLNRYSISGQRTHSLWMLWLILLLCTNVFAQSTRYTLKGRVTDSNGQGIPGVTALLRGTQLGTTSIADGSYTLGVTVAPGSYSLTFSSIGYTSKDQIVNLGNQESVVVNATLAEENQTLDEVIVAASTLSGPRRQFGNAITTIKGQELTQTGTGGLINALQGKVPGAQITQNSGDPAGGISVRLRGVKSLSGSSDPLYIIDGVIVSNASDNVSQLAAGSQIGGANAAQNRLADLNPNDIASLNVVNGAAAAAQYGSRAANGVVLITTKRGQTGAPRISFTTSFNVNELRKNVPLGTLNKQFGFAGLRLHPIGGVSAAQIAANPGTTTIGTVRDGATTQLATNLVDVQRYNYFDQIFRTGYGTDNSLSVSGGANNTNYYVSFGYLKNQGIIKGTDFARYNFRARLDQRLTTWAKLSAGLSYSNSFSNEKANGNVFYSPINSVSITNNIWDITQRDAAGNLQAVEPTRVNPLSTIEDMKFTQSVNRTISDLQLNLTPLKGLSVDWIVGVDTYGQFGKNYIRPYPYQSVAGLPLERFPFGYAATATNNVMLLNSDVTVGYERYLTDNFKLNVIAGYNYQFSQTDFSRNEGQNLAPFIETVSGASSTTFGLGYGLDRFNLSGYFGQATLAYRNLAFLTGALRRDASSKFSPSETNQTYPKLSGSLVLSDLDFWKKSAINNIWSDLKLRASYGASGNLSGIGSYSRFWQFQPIPFLGRNTIIPSSTLANPAVRPERMTELEGGVDMSFLNNRINLTATAYNQQISDLVVNRTLAPSTGGTGIINNVGTMENRGIELMLDVTPVKTKDFSWDFTVIFNRNRNKILQLGSPRIEISTVSGAPVFLLEGQPASVFFEFPYARNPDGSLLLTSEGLPQRERGTQSTASIDYTVQRTPEGQPTGTFIRKIIGDPNPKWTGSFASNVSYKQLSLRFLLDAVQGNQVFNADKRTRENVGIGTLTEQEMRGTLKRGYIFAIGPIGEFRVDDGSFVKLREVALNYRLPNFVKGLNSLNIALIGRNLISWDKYNGFDPETNSGGNADLVRGVDFGNVPIPRTYQVQLSASF
ncbi:SusC/RagA family TonB-linked outer membrane protein [Spirosoma fluviale]|uniref:TonB-linked outer membrane protein, SusC/RagA family n=1 Tax=Spirosoma fluviale TaxID=1597977 RepID=A0A286G1P8_9BACT|nr:SusC/RagA family TonB-linked outer membrane protein [Spirosoma fluviale]SOD89470.1 TonB-linked outer membrane protein, SusC/RagA family [Spirosoma fluviale]